MSGVSNGACATIMISWESVSSLMLVGLIYVVNSLLVTRGV